MPTLRAALQIDRRATFRRMPPALDGYRVPGRLDFDPQATLKPFDGAVRRVRRGERLGQSWARDLYPRDRAMNAGSARRRKAVPPLPPQAAAPVTAWVERRTARPPISSSRPLADDRSWSQAAPMRPLSEFASAQYRHLKSRMVIPLPPFALKPDTIPPRRLRPDNLRLSARHRYQR